MKKKIKVILIIGLIILGIFIVAISCRKVEEKQDSQTTNSSKNEIDEVAVEELKKESSKVQISILCPGPVDTNFNIKLGIKFGVKPKDSSYVAIYAINQMFKRKKGASI